MAKASFQWDDPFLLQQQLSEVVERQEFTERLLAKVRQERGLPGAGSAER